MNITRDELLAEITRACEVERALPQSDEGMTVRELAEAWQCGEHTARRRVYAAVDAGRLIQGKRYVIDKANRCVSFPVYRPA